ncbi:MAG: dihydrolipoyl dehydrogenase family protein [Microcoleaceae cyanobacterium]
MLDYDIVVIGGSLTGRYAALAAAQMQARVALVEPKLPANPIGSILGQIYSQALIAASHRIQSTGQFSSAGLVTPETTDWSAIQQWAWRTTENITHQHSLAKLSALGIVVIPGLGEFSAQPRLHFQVHPVDQVDTRGRLLISRTYLLATPDQPRVPEVPGLTLTGFLTPKTIGKLTQIPGRLLVIGGEPQGIELAQALAQLGSTVTIVVKQSHILAQEDSEAACWIQAQLEAQGIRVLTQTEIVQAQMIQGKKWVQAGNQAIEVDEILLAAGQQPDLSHLNLESAQVRQSGAYLQLNSKLQTTNPRIYACGEATGGYSFINLANHEAKIAVKNALYFPWFPVNYQGIPWAIFSYPQLARVGLTEAQARQRYGAEIWVTQDSFEENTRTALQAEVRGFIKLVGRQNNQLLGASVVSTQAGEMINLLGMAIRQEIKLEKMADSAFVWPTFSEGVTQIIQNRLQQRRQAQRFRYDWIESLFHWRRYWS